MSGYEQQVGSSENLFEYARGFALTYGASKKVPLSWVKVDVHGWVLSHDPRVPFDMYASGDTIVAVLGHALLIDGNVVSTDVARIVCNAEKSGSAQQYIDRVCGRFVLFTFDQTVRIQQDAAGLRAVFYSKDRRVAASHPRLVADQTDEPKGVFAREALKEMKLGCMPGNATEYDGIFAQTPNTELNLSDGSVHRIYYGELSGELSVEEVAQALMILVKKQIPWLETLDPVISLSAGLDSRTSLALLRPMKSTLKGFTYTSASLRGNANALHDLDVATKLAKISRIDFQTLNIDEASVNDPLKDALRSNFYRSHGAKLAALYLDKIPNQMNIRSNSYGIGRASYDKVNIAAMDSKGMARLAFGTNPKRNDQKIIGAFDAYAKETDFPAEADVNFKDLFFWEHRIGVWQSAIYLEADLSHYSHVMINQREMLRKLLSVPKSDRLNGNVFKSVIRASWPGLTEFDVNGVPF